ncbi:restriction endonuclease subunit S [Adhaeribacter terreus]|uniref:Restriction endonuclease subunit S n=1 Tax=Adhaeribacter terreus TaxID=529703 RepID=A0ABW0EET1_9BACT
MAVISTVKLSELKPGFRIDSEFYQPDYLFLERELKAFSCRKIKSFAKVTDGEHGSVKLRANGIKYLTAENVKNGYIDISKVRFVDEEVDRRNRRASVRAGDVLISIKGTLGEVAIAEEWLLPANMNRDVAIIKPFENSEILPEYLTIFLMSKFGAFQAKREGSGGVQQMITLGRLREFLVPKLPEESQEKIKSLYLGSLSKKVEADSLYSQASKFLEDALGLNHISLKNEKTFTAKLSHISNRNRFDGEHYKPRYIQLKEIIKNYKNGWEYFLLNVQYKRPNFNPVNSPNKVFNYIELSDINSNFGVVNSSNLIKGKEAPSRAKRVVNHGDIIVSSVVGSIDKAAIVSKSEDNHLASTGFFHFRSTVYSPQFLLLLVRSKLFTEQLFQESTGGILSAVPDSNLRHIIIPKFSIDIQETITDLVSRAHQAHWESKELLEQAKQEVETLIEQTETVS